MLLPEHTTASVGEYQAMKMLNEVATAIQARLPLDWDDAIRLARGFVTNTLLAALDGMEEVDSSFIRDLALKVQEVQ